MKKTLAAFGLLASSTVFAHTPITLMATGQHHAAIPIDKVSELVKQNLYADDFRQIKVQVVFNQQKNPDHLLMYLFAKTSHRVQIARLDINASYQATKNIQRQYHFNAADKAAQPVLEPATCPDPSVQFIAFAPNDIQLEQDITIDVAKHGEDAGLKTVRLLIKDATAQNYINYMSCPKVVGNFYDGDADPYLITTNDGTIESDTFSTTLKGAFRKHVTNFWLACEAFNNPMHDAVIADADAQKYAAGINDLLVGPSDRAAGCAMKASIDGTAIDKAFNQCVKQDDDPDTSPDVWGFGGDGSNRFGH